MNTPIRHGLPALALTLLFAATAGAPASAHADFKDRNFKFAYVLTKDTPLGLGVTRLSELAAQKTGGKMKIKAYSDAQLGGEVATVSGAQGGIIEMTFVATSVMAGVQPEFALYDLPFLFNTDQEADAVLDGPIGQGLLAKLSDKKLKGLCYWDIGFRQLSNRKHAINTVDDFKGLKIRVIQNPVFVDLFNALGATATPLAYSELYTALDSKAVDGQESPYANHFYSKFYEVQKYVTDSRLTYGAGVILVSQRAWDSLAADEKTALQQACVEAGSYQRTTTRKTNERLLDELKKQGMSYNQVSPENRAAMRSKVAPVLAKYEKNVGDALVKQTQAQLAAMRTGK